jgi:peptide/nickel transport system substrate-binding protein
MNARISRNKARRIFRSRKRQVGDLTESASRHIDRHVFRRLNNFGDIARFVGAWLGMMLILIAGVAYQNRTLASYYLESKPVPGGVLNEGVVGTFTNPNPLFASSTIDLSVSKLIFNSILTYNEKGQLVPDLAESVTRSDDGLTYTVVLRQDVLWQDGHKFSSSDVVYTYKAIQNPDTRSPYNISWQGIAIEATDERTVTFKLPSALNSFTISLTNGIVPAHILSKVNFSELRSAEFNSIPVGTGPFILNQAVRLDDFETLEKRQRIELVRNDAYFKGRPGLEAFIIYALADDQELIDGLETRQIDSAIFNSYPTLNAEKPYVVKNVPLQAGTYLFFNLSQSPFDSRELRQALVQGTQVNNIVEGLEYPLQAVDSPLLSNQTGYDTNITQLTFDPAKANQVLDSLGWPRSAETGLRTKDGVAIELVLTTLEGSDFARVASYIQTSWLSEMGIKVSIVTKNAQELQPLLLQHSYQMLLYGVSLGVDPDVYAYWHSSQAVVDRFNLSLYKSDVSDRALEAGRSRPDVALRAAKYKPFLEAWKNDAPAIGLYQPPVFYVSEQTIYGFDTIRMNSVADRYYNVHNWKVTTNKLPIIED